MKQHLDCRIVEDLLPNYIENFTNDYTNKAVEEHLTSCEECSELLNTMKADISVQQTAPKREIKFLQKMKRTRIVAIVSSILLFVLLIGIISFVVFSIYSSTFRGMALSRTSLTDIDSITSYTSGGPQTLVLGSDGSGDEKAVWLSRNKEIQGTAYLKEMISEDEARLIALDNDMVDEDLSIELRYFEETTDVVESIGPYWVARDHGDIMVFIDAYTGDVSFLDMGPVEYP